MNLSPRDKWMCAIIPALLTGLIYQYAFIHPVGVDIESIQKRLDTQGPLAARQAALKQAEADHAQLLHRVADMKKPGITRLHFNRTAALQQISKLCESGGLTLVSSSPDTAAKLPPSIDQVASLLASPADSLPPQIWRLELQGSYPAMVEFLDGLGATPTLVVPLNLGLQPNAEDTRPLNWTVSVWL